MDILRDDGTVHGLYVTSPSGRRPLAIQVKVSRAGFPNLNLCQSIDGRDFGDVYQRVIDQIAEYYDIGHRTALYARLCESQQCFLKTRGLRIQEVVYGQLVLPGGANGE